jgi:hypothetical protein
VLRALIRYRQQAGNAPGGSPTTCGWIGRVGGSLPDHSEPFVARVVGEARAVKTDDIATATLTGYGGSGKVGELSRERTLVRGRVAVGVCFLRTQQGV